MTQTPPRMSRLLVALMVQIRNVLSYPSNLMTDIKVPYSLSSLTSNLTLFPSYSKQFAGAVIGKGGQNIQKLRNEVGVLLLFQSFKLFRFDIHPFYQHNQANVASMVSHTSNTNPSQRTLL